MTEINQNQLAQIEQSVSEDQIQLSEQVGALKATGFFKKVSTVTEIKLIAEIKESKKYKGLRLISHDEKYVTCSTFQDFCNAIGYSYEKINQDIQNLGYFGEDFLETSQRMGLGYRDLRKLRKLDDAEREIVINGEAVKTEDRESLIDLIEEMSAKHTKEKTALKKKVDDLSADVDAKDKIIKNKDDKINKQDTELTKLKSPPEIAKRTESEPQLLRAEVLKELGSACLTMHNNVVRFTNDINSLLDVINERELFDIQEKLEISVVGLFQQIAQTSVELGIQIDFETMVNPDWTMTVNPEFTIEPESDLEV